MIIGHRTNVPDRQGHSVHLSRRVPDCWHGLIKRIFFTKIDPGKAILSFEESAAPTVFTVRASHKSEFALVVFYQRRGRGIE